MIDFKTVMLDKDDNPIKQNYRTQVIEKGKPKDVNDYRETTLYDVCRVALLNSSEGEVKYSDILNRYNLFMKIKSIVAGVVGSELTKDEKEMLCQLICERYEVIIAGQAISLIIND